MIANIFDKRTESDHTVCDATIEPAWHLNDINKDSSYVKDCDFEAINVKAEKIANIIKQATDVQGSTVVVLFDSYFLLTRNQRGNEPVLQSAAQTVAKPKSDPNVIDTNDIYKPGKVY